MKILPKCLSFVNSLTIYHAVWYFIKYLSSAVTARAATAPPLLRLRAIRPAELACSGGLFRSPRGPNQFITLDRERACLARVAEARQRQQQKQLPQIWLARIAVWSDRVKWVYNKYEYWDVLHSFRGYAPLAIRNGHCIILACTITNLHIEIK